MATDVLEDVVAKARTLAPDELCELRDRIDSWLPERERREELLRRLRAKGMLTRPEAPPPDPADFRAWRPVPVKGEPVSRTIVRDREQ